MDWAVNEFSVSGTPVLQVFDTFLPIVVNNGVAGAAATDNKKGASSTLSVGQAVASNIVVLNNAAVSASFTAATVPDAFDMANWT